MSQSQRPLQAARIARGWSQSRAAEELAALAAARGVVVAAPGSLKTQLSRWENQHALPDEHYRALLRALYESTDAELGLVEPTVAVEPAASDADELRARMAVSSAIDDAAVELIEDQLRSTRALDDRLGAAATAGPARAQLSYLEVTFHHATNPWSRRRLGLLVADAAVLAGRIALDTGQPTEAWRCQETAKAAARESGSQGLLGCAMVEQSQVLLDLGEPSLAVSFVEQAMELAVAQAPGPLRAWFAAALGEAMASTGARNSTYDAYRTAESQLTRGPGGKDIAFPSIALAAFDKTALRRHRGHAYRILHDHESAIADLESALVGGTAPVRDVASIHLDLAWVHREVGHEAEANRHARAAREIASRIGSRRIALLLDSETESQTHELSRS